MQEITNKLLSLLPSSPSKSSSKKEESTTTTMPTSKNKNMLSLEDEVASMQLLGTVNSEVAADTVQRERAIAMVDTYKNANSKQQQKQQQQQPQAVTLCTPQDIASLPLLQPFNIRNTNQSTIINTIINEQHSNDSLLSVLKREEELRKELALFKDGKSKKDSKDDDKKDGKDAKDDSKDVSEEKDVNGRAAALSNAKGGSKRDKKAAKKKKLSPKEEAKVKELEMNIDAINMLVKQQRESLAQFANWTKGEFILWVCLFCVECCLWKGVYIFRHVSLGGIVLLCFAQGCYISWLKWWFVKVGGYGISVYVRRCMSLRRHHRLHTLQFTH